MNAHNEQQALPCPFCGREPDLSFNSVSCGCAASPFIDREDALQVWNTRAAQPSPVVKQNLTTAAAQEAVAKVGSDHFRSIVDWLGPIPPPNTLLYAAPITAAPADHLHAHLLHMLGAKDHEDAGRIIGELHAATMRNPAAPGIDMGVPGATLTIAGKTFTVDEVRAALLPGASPKDELESWKRGTKACAEVLGQVMRQTQDSPKGGSAACERIAAMLHQEATDEPWTVCGVEHDGPDRAYYRELARRVLDAAQAGDAEVQP